jgi:hypothetical protein
MYFLVALLMPHFYARIYEDMQKGNKYYNKKVRNHTTRTSAWVASCLFYYLGKKFREILK